MATVVPMWTASAGNGLLDVGEHNNFLTAKVVRMWLIDYLIFDFKVAYAHNTNRATSNPFL